jgi:hypothetical protein
MAVVKKFVIPAAGGRNAFTIYSVEENINYFLKTPLTPAAVAGPTNKQVAVKAYQRRQGPGDAKDINMPATQREVLIDPTRKSGSALPGRSIVLVGDAGMIMEERRQFTLQGRWVDFHAWLRSNAKMEIQAYNKSGTRYTIPAAGTTP